MKENKKEKKSVEEEKVAAKQPEVAVEDDEREALKEKVNELEAEIADLKDQNIRRQADTENYRKRLVREKEEAVLFANTKLISDLLQFMDNLERAISAAKSGGDVKVLTEGIEMIQSQLLGTLDRNWGLKAIDALNQEFDPNKHEACMQVVDPSLEHETVIEEFQKGYMLHDRVIRPSKVKIGKPQ